MIQPQIIYVVWCIFWAYANHRAIDKANEHILHAINGTFHLVICGYFGIQLNWMVGVAMLFEGRLFFDVALNLFRKLGIGYVPKSPKSIFDKLEKYVFKGNGIIPKIIYAAIVIVLNILI
jgi:hypothetical protein